MLVAHRTAATSLLPSRATVSRRRVVAASQGRFDEGADRVRQLLQRDRKEMKQLEEIGAGLRAEFDDDIPEEASNASLVTPLDSGAAKVSSPFKGPAAPASPFGGPSSTASPFGAPANAGSPFGREPRRQALLEPEGLSPTMAPIQIDDQPWWKKITVTQVVIALSFAFSIGLMLVTFWVVLKSGAVRFNED